MSGFKIEEGSCYSEFKGVSNYLYIEINENDYDEQGNVCGIINQNISFDAYGKEFKDFVKIINKINKELNNE